VVHLLPVDDDVRITKTFERIHGKLRVLRFSFLRDKMSAPFPSGTGRQYPSKRTELMFQEAIFMPWL
jgi:hypothetical protein